MPKYKLPEPQPWLPIESAPINQVVNIIFPNGQTSNNIYYSDSDRSRATATHWQPITPLEVERFELKEGVEHHFVAFCTNSCVYSSGYNLGYYSHALNRLTGNYSETPIDPSKFDRIREILASVHDLVQGVINE